MEWKEEKRWNGNRRLNGTETVKKSLRQFYEHPFKF